jgi:hypothetical protein
MPIFMPRFTAVADRIVPALIDDVAGQGEIDFSFQFTERLAARLWGDFIGMTAEESERIAVAVRGMGPLFLQRRTPEQIRAMNAATGEYQHLIASAVERTLRYGTNAVLNEMAAGFDRIDVEGKPESLGRRSPPTCSTDSTPRLWRPPTRSIGCCWTRTPWRRYARTPICS